MRGNKWWILVAVSSCIAMIFIDITVLPVALPTIQRMLGISEFSLQWIVNAYTLTLTLLVLAGGRLGDRFGLRRIFCIGLFFFSLGSVLCALSMGATWFIFSRVVQGVGGAFMLPTSSAIIMNAFPPKERGKALGFYVSIGSIFLIFGPLIGGLLSQYLSWRLIFWINIPIAIIGFILTLAAVKPSQGHEGHFDWKGFLTITLGIGCLVVPLMQTKEWGWLSPLTLGSICLGLTLIILSLYIDRNKKEAYIDVSLFKNRTILGCFGTIFTTQFLIMITVFWAIYFQEVLNYTPSNAGILTLIANLPVVLIAPFAGYLLDRFGPRMPITIGFTLVIGSLLWYLQIIETKNPWLLISALLPFGCGIPFIFPPSFTTVMNQVPPEKRGLTSGMATMIRQFGGSIGLAVLGSIFVGQKGSIIADRLLRNQATEKLRPSELEGLLSKTPKAVALVESLPAQVSTYITQSVRHATIDAFYALNTLALAIAIVGLIATWLFLKKNIKAKY